MAGGKMKSVTGWNSPNTGATNESEFLGLPGGFRLYFGSYSYMGEVGGWWSSTVGATEGGFNRNLRYFSSNSYRNYYEKTTGFSIRCIKD